MAERFVVLGLAHTRSRWFGEVARWSATAAAPLEFVKCMTSDEVRAILGAGRRVSAVIVDGAVTQFDRDVVAAADDAGAVTIVVDERRSGRDWDALGCAAVLDGEFDRATLMEILGRHATSVDRIERRAARAEIRLPTAAISGRLIGVTGTGGTGASTVAMALAQGLAMTGSPTVALADGARRSDLAMYHDVGDVMPGLTELVELHRADRPDPDDIRSLLFDVPERRYDLLLGLCRSRDWPALRPRAVGAAIDGLRRTYDTVVVDFDDDVEGEAQSGSIDVEERNAVARATANAADLVLVVTRPGLKGVHDVVRTIDDLCECGTPITRIVPVFNQATRHPAHRSEMVRALRALTIERRRGPQNPTERGARPGVVGDTAPPVFVRPTRLVEEAHRGGSRLPDAMCRALARSVNALLDRMPALPVPLSERPVRVRPGELGSAITTGEEVA